MQGEVNCKKRKRLARIRTWEENSGITTMPKEFRESEERSMYFMLDNYDSFVYNLSASFRELGREILVKRAREITLSEIEALHPEGIILSPGPGKPSDAAESLRILERFKEKIPILGVCLGHQSVGHYFGARIKKGNRPMHGKLSTIRHLESGLFDRVPQGIQVTRYHSLVVDGENFPKELAVDAVSEDGVIMGIHHKTCPVYGVQFHPEAVLTEYGREILENFVKICDRWGGAYENHKSA